LIIFGEVFLWISPASVEIMLRHCGGGVGFVVANASNVKKVPGGKTEVKGAESIADLLGDRLRGRELDSARPSANCAS
jgi:hypothetical protein